MADANLRRKNEPRNEQRTRQHSSIKGATSVQASRESARLPTFGKVLTASVILAAAFSFLYRRDLAGTNPLPNTYALCSKDGESIYTVDHKNNVVQCLLVHDTRILHAGSLDGVKVFWNSYTNVTSVAEPQGRLDAQTSLPIRHLPRGAVVVPGFSDSHGHILEYGASRLLPLESSEDSAAAVARVRNYILSRPEILNDSSRIIEGWGWDHTVWPVEKFPSYKELEEDPIVRGRPIILQSKDGHALWVSRALLEQMLPLPDNVEGGIVIRDDNGNATGVFLDKAQDLIQRPPPTYADRLLRFERTVKDALSNGLTMLHDAGFDPESLEFFKKQSERENLPIRIYGMRYFNEKAGYWGDKAEKIINKNRLTSRSVKIFADGALRSGGAALFEPYTDNPDTSGFMRIHPEVLFEVLPKFARDGWQVNIHAIGDKANSIVLDAIESVWKASPGQSKELAMRHRIEHAQIMLPEDAVRLAELGVIASVQPTHAVSDMWYAQERLGPERIKNLYAFRTVIDAGARITLGSDFPVEDINPLVGIHAAITRLSPNGRSPHGPMGWFPEQCLTRLEALRGFTIDPAYASFMEEDLGSLEPGKIADFTVLSQDIMNIPVDMILKTEVIATAIDGKVVFGVI